MRRWVRMRYATGSDRVSVRTKVLLTRCATTSTQRNAARAALGLRPRSKSIRHLRLTSGVSDYSLLIFAWADRVDRVPQRPLSRGARKGTFHAHSGYEGPLFRGGAREGRGWGAGGMRVGRGWGAAN